MFIKEIINTGSYTITDIGWKSFFTRISENESINKVPKDDANSWITPELINKCAAELEKNEAVILATQVTDTIKIVDNKGFIKETPNRQYLWAAQTPQGFLVDSLKKAHKMAIDKN